MAIAFDAQSGSNGTATSLTVSHTASGSDRYAFTGVVGENSSDVITGVTYGGAAMTLWDKVQAPGWRWLYLFYILNPATGAQNVVASASLSTYIELITDSYTGVSQVAPEAPGSGSRTNTGSSITSLTTSATTVSDNAWRVQACIAQSGGIVAGSGTTQRRTVLVGAMQDSGGAITPAGSGSLVMANGGASTQMGAIIAVIAPSSAPAPTSFPFRRGGPSNVILTRF